MSREGALAILVIVVAGVFLAMYLGWRRRKRRDEGLQAPVLTSLPEAEPLAVFDGFYVATTRHQEPLDRLFIAALTFRGRVTVRLYPDAVLLEIPGEPLVAIPADRLRAAGIATWTIDRVVERDGLVFLAWDLDGTVVDSYFRVGTASSAALLTALQPLLPVPTTLGTTE